jgi:hypothetical protein
LIFIKGDNKEIKQIRKERTSIRFIEQWFQLSPDNGNGAMEVAYVVTVALLAVVISSQRYIIKACEIVRRRLLKKSWVFLRTS